MLHLIILVGVALYAAAAPALYSPDSATTYQMTMKSLILSSDPVLSKLPVSIMNAYEQPYDVIELVDHSTFPLAAADPEGTWLTRLTDTAGNALYNSIVLTSSELAYDNAEGQWVSAVAENNWSKLWSFTAKYHVRVVIMASSWTADEGLSPYPGWESGSNASAVLSFIDNELTSTLLADVKITATFKIGQVNEFVRTSYWYYPTMIKENASSYLKPFMYINPVDMPACQEPVVSEDKPLVCNNTPPNWIGGFLRQINNREELHFTVNSNTYGHHGFVLANIWFPWMVRGVWPGKRRILLDTQVDDIFLTTGLYNVQHNRQHWNDEPSYRMTGSDMKLLVDYQQALNEALPIGSRFVVQLALNGLGWYSDNEGEDNLNKVVHTYRDNFFWLSHTWSHIDMYCYFSDCDVYGFTAYNDTLWDLIRNIDFSENILFFNVPANSLATWPTYSPHSLITPRISGLNLSQSIGAMRDANITTAVGDNSRLDLRPTNIYHGFNSLVEDHNDRTVFIIPRWATRIYFDVSLPVEAAKEHGSIYGPECIGSKNDSPIIFPWKCNSTSFKYSREITFEEILMIESFEAARNVLMYRHDPYMFHQDRMVRDRCGIDVKINIVDGQWESLIFHSTNGACSAKVSRTSHTTLQFTDGVVEEKYGMDYTRDVILDGIHPITLTFGTPLSTTYKPYLPYPPVDTYPPLSTTSSDTNTLPIVKYQSVILNTLANLEKNLKKRLYTDFLVVDEFIDMNGLQCKPIGVDSIISNAYKEFDEASRPAQDAREFNSNRSWYLHVEETIAVTMLELKEHAKEVISDSITQAEIIGAQFASNCLDRLENLGTLLIKRRYSNMDKTLAVLNSIPFC